MTLKLEGRIARLEQRHPSPIETMILGDDWPIKEMRGKEVPATYIKDLLRSIDGKSRLPVKFKDSEA